MASVSIPLFSGVDTVSADYTLDGNRLSTLTIILDEKLESKILINIEITGHRHYKLAQQLADAINKVMDEF